MTPATLLLVLQIVQLVEAEIPQAVALVKSLKKALATDPAVPGALTALATDASTDAKAAVNAITAWQTQHGIVQ